MQINPVRLFKMDWITKNLRDRAQAFEQFLHERRKIILELQKVHIKMKQNPSSDEKIILDISEQTLISQLQHLEQITETQLTKIRERRNNTDK